MVITMKEPEMDQDVEEISDPVRLMERGNRSQKIGDYEDAVAAFSRACSLLTRQYGELSLQCADTYFCYGKALLELYRQESSPVEQEAFNDTDALLASGHKVSFTDEDDDNNKQTGSRKKEDDDEKDEVKNDVSSEADRISTEETEILKTHLPSKYDTLLLDSENVKNGSDSESSTRFCESTAGSSGALPSTSKDEGDNTEENDLELAWDMLELAKKIWESSEQTDERKALISQVYMTLGEISTENETFDIAVADMQKGISMMELLNGTDHIGDRDIAQAYYQLGTVYILNFQTNLAVEAFNTAKDFLNKRLEKIDKNSDEAKEIKNELLREIDDKIEETKCLKKEEMTKIAKIVAKSSEGNGISCGFGSSSTSGSQSSGTSSVVNDVSHLVKRKRKSEEPAAGGGTVTKATKQLKMSE